VRMNLANPDLARAIGALVVILLTWVAARFAAASIRSFSDRSEHRLFSVSLFTTLVQVAILIIGLLTVLSSLGIAIAPLLTTLGLGGLAVALALNDTLTNLFAGVHIVAARQIRIGDFVKFDFAEGQVIDIKWHNTTIRDAQNNQVVIPNAKVNTSVFTNYSMSFAEVIVPVTVTLPWKGSSKTLEAIALEAAREAVSETVDRAQAQGSRALLTAINDTNVQITAYLPIGTIDNRISATSAFLRRLHDAASAAVTESADEAARPEQSVARAADPQQ
jgi:small-conductance mechanosensitive channel